MFYDLPESTAMYGARPLFSPFCLPLKFLWCCLRESAQHRVPMVPCCSTVAKPEPPRALCPSTTRPPPPFTPPGPDEHVEPRGNWAGGKGNTRGNNRAGQTALAENGAERRRRRRKGQKGKNHCGC